MNEPEIFQTKKVAAPRIEIRQPVQPPANAAEPSRVRSMLKLLLVLILAGVLFMGGLVVSRAVNLSNKIFVGQKTTFFGKIKELIRGGSGSKLIGEDLGQVNVLLLGIGGEGHDGPYLTDTMILAQIRPDTGEIAMTSIPRDYLVTLPGKGERKINAVFYEGLGKNKDWNSAGQASIDMVEQISGLDIPYFAVVDFSGFEKAINQLGGIDVHIDRTFTDYQFPDDRLIGYLPPLTFKEGDEHMDGRRALQFARSRHAAGPEGSDFARSQRQQKVIDSFKQKALSLNVIKDVGTINELLGTFADHFHTNIRPSEMFRLYGLSKDKNMQTLSLSLDPATKLICSQMSETAGYVLVPCAGKSKDDVKNFFKNAFALGKLSSEHSVVWLANSTKSQSAYQKADTALKQAGMTVWELAYSQDELIQTVFYQVNPKPATAEYLKNQLGASEVQIPPPGVNVNKDKVDIVLILGTR